MIPRLKPALGYQEFLAALQPPRQDDVARFESVFAEMMGHRHAIAFPYGRTGLMFLLQALDLKNKEIICPAYTCVVVPHAIVHSGNTPVFIDCKKNSFNMDLDMAEQAITGKTGALIATSLFGYPVDLDRLDQIRQRHPQVHVIQDCAHSFAAEWKERPVQREGIAALFGFNISKILTSIFGGMITTDDERLCQKLRSVSGQVLKPASWRKNLRRLLYLVTVYPTFCKPIYSIINHLERSGRLNNFVQYYDELKIDMPKDYLESMCGVEARVGAANVKRYEDIISTRRTAAKYYFENLSRIIGHANGSHHNISPFSIIAPGSFLLPPQVDGATYSHFVIQVSNRDQWLKKGIEKDVQLGWLIEYNIPEMISYGSHKPEEFPIAAQYSRTSVNLPVWGGERVAKKVLQNLCEDSFNEESLIS